jgi:cation diffusion facilitator family transporter
MSPVHNHDHGHEHAHHHHEHGERGARLVFLLTVATMGAEIFAGWLYGSMALLADGWHMASHAGALGIAWFAYAFARRHAHNPDFVFGTGKVNALAGFASAVGLLIVALFMAGESFWRFLSPVPIAFGQATLVAVLGLLVNLASAWLLRDEHESHASDHNLKAAYLHVLADALTSILAIGALLGGRYLGLVWLDPLMGVVGAAVISRWAAGLIRETGAVLLDHLCVAGPAARICGLVEDDAQARVADIAVWRLGARELAASLVVEDAAGRGPEHFRQRLAGVENLARLTIEVRAAHGGGHA